MPVLSTFGQKINLKQAGVLFLPTPCFEKIHSVFSVRTKKHTSERKKHTVPFLKRGALRGHSRKVFGQRRPRSTLWVPSGPMDAPNDREAPGANPDGLHCGPARRTWARARSCTDARHGAVHHGPARAPPWLPAARQVPLGPLDTAPPLVDLALAVSEFAGARRVQTGCRIQGGFCADST